jgi:hypothetical protein
VDDFTKCPACGLPGQRRTKCLCGFAFVGGGDTGAEAPVPGSWPRMFLGFFLGVPMGAAVWALSGAFVGAATFAAVRLLMIGHEFHGNFLGDLVRVTLGMGALFGLPGLLVGGIAGGRVGWTGRPLVSATCDGSFHALIRLVSNPIFLFPAMFGLAPLIVDYLADPRNFTLQRNLISGAVGFGMGFLIYPALVFRVAMAQRVAAAKQREKEHRERNEIGRPPA